jgi:hypothetical protein
MQQHVYEYAVIRVVPQVEREEFLNVGVILFCKSLNFVQMKYQLDVERLRIFSPSADAFQIEQNLQSFEKIAQGDTGGGPIAKEDTASRFRWLTAVRSSVIQTSRPHPGLCGEPLNVLDKLFDELVLVS